VTDPFPDKVVIVCSSTEATSTSKNNSNKFHKWEKLPSGEYTHTYGRVGDPGVSHTVSEAKARAKMKSALKDGYKQVNLVDAPAAAVKTGNGPKTNVTQQAADEIAKGDPVITKLVTYLAEKNVHNISQATTLKYNADTGLFSTPLGIVTQDSITQARTLLAKIESVVTKAAVAGKAGSDKLATEYMMLIPTDIGRDRPTFERLFPDAKAVFAQNDILDSLEGSLTMALKPAVKTDTKEPVKRTWNLSLKAVDDKKEIERIRKKFKATLNMQHECARAGLDVKSVYELSIDHMAKAFEAEGRKLGNIEEMWHGTSVGNVLSIFAKGLIIPEQYSNGRLFGNGVYASRQSTKSLNYAYGYWGGGARDKNCFMFLVEVALGKAYVPTSRMSRPPAGYDSLDVQPGSCGVMNHEAIVYKTSQTNVVRLIEFSA
jgi:poly [ADP-ribose] polymerase